MAADFTELKKAAQHQNLTAQQKATVQTAIAQLEEFAKNPQYAALNWQAILAVIMQIVMAFLATPAPKPTP